MPDRFTIRVYGILTQNNCVLISDEKIMGKHITKFPGGGLEFGESTIDCVIREFKEELDLKIKVLSHFYTTDFFVESAFSPNTQVISIYYKVEALEELQIKIESTAHNYAGSDQSFRWLELQQISEDDFTFPIDKKVSLMLKKN